MFLLVPGKNDKVLSPWAEMMAGEAIPDVCAAHINGISGLKTCGSHSTGAGSDRPEVR
jgi:hypothetical protein